MIWIVIGIVVVVVILIAVVIYDLVQTQHAILRNFPIIGHFRYLLEAVGPELRQYIVTNNDEERPFSRDHRRWVYASAKRQNNYFGFGTDNDIEGKPGYLIVKHAAFPLADPGLNDPNHDPLHEVPCAKVLGGRRGRAHAFRPSSIVNVSAMSYGSLSAPAVEAINRGCHIAGSLHNTGEGGVSTHHRHGAGLVWQIGTGYFGCRDADGRFSMERLQEVVAEGHVRAIEVKLSQGAKPGLGGVLPAAKVTPEIAAIRGVPVGRDCISPSAHEVFHDVDSMLDFVEKLAEVTGVPVGIKSAVGESGFWRDLAGAMTGNARGVDFITIDGGEGGSGAAPLVFSDHVALPFKVAFSKVFAIFAEHGIADDVVFIGSGKLGLPDSAVLGLGLGCDMLNVAREAMLAIGCIQAQRCHTGHCPTGVATQGKWLMRGLDPTDKSARLANYVITLRKELQRIARACGEPHPALITLDHLEILGDRFQSSGAREVFGYEADWTSNTAERRDELVALTASARGDAAG